MALTETCDWFYDLEEMKAADPVTVLADFVERDSLYRHEDCINKQGVFDTNPETRQAFLHTRAQEFLDGVVEWEKAQARVVGKATLCLFTQSES